MKHKKINQKKELQSMCSYFVNMFAKTTTNVSLPEIFKAIKTGKIFENNFANQIHAIRQETDKNKRRALKSALPAITFGGTYKNSQRTPLINSSNHICLDYDQVPNLLITKKTVGELPYTSACFISPSGDGLKIIVKAKKTNEAIYKEAINQVFDYYKEYAGIDSDKSKVNLNDFCYLSHDPNIIVNEDSKIWVVKEAKAKREKRKQALPIDIKVDPNVEALINKIEKEKIDITLEYEDWIRLAYAFATAYSEAGRSLFIRVSQFHEDYKNEKTDKQYTQCLKNNTKEITVSTFFHIAKKYGVEVEESNSRNGNFHFWFDTDKGYKIYQVELFEYIFNAGFRRYDLKGDGSLMLVKINNMILSQVEKSNLVKWFFDFIEALNISEVKKKSLKNTFYNNQRLFSDNNLQTLNPFNDRIKTDERDKARLYFKNCICEISKASIKTIGYDQLDGYVWASKIRDHNFQLENNLDKILEESEICKFLSDVCEHTDKKIEQKRIDSIWTIISYLIHDYKDPATTKCIILMDANDSDEPNGGTGKGILSKIISHVVSMVREDGKKFSDKSEFMYSQVTPETKVLFIDDIPEYFNFENLFSIITDGMVVDKKYENKKYFAYENTPKVLLTTNYTVFGEGESHQRRKVEFELSNYYNINYSPKQKFGHLLFNDWDNEQWNLFYNFIAYAMQFYLKNGLIQPPPININLKRLRARAGEEFIEFINTNVKPEQEYTKSTIYTRFKDQFRNYSKIRTQKTFTLCLKLYSKANNLTFHERKSGERYFFTLSTKTEINRT